MTNAKATPPAVGLDPSLIHTGEIIERAPALRPSHATVDAIAEWLLGPALQFPSGAHAFDEFAWRLYAAGFPLARITLHSGTLHPQFLGTTFAWWRDAGQTVQTFVAHEVGETVPYAQNPVLRVTQGGETLRRNLEAQPSELDLPILRDLLAKGCTDYLALPIPGAHGRRYAMTFVTDRQGGFTPDEVSTLTGIAQRVAVLCDTFSQRALTHNLLRAYLGAKAGLTVLAGQIRRGTGEELDVVLWSSDLRGFTARSDRLPGQQMIAILNALFDAQASAIHQHGGEILKFIGDGLLAIFPIDEGRGRVDAAANAMAAAGEAQDAVRRLADHASMVGEPVLNIVVALHAGAVIYGNVGAVDRLDFTVIGPAVNLVSRVESVAKLLDEPIVVSAEFAAAYGKPLRSLGSHELRGLVKARELFAPL